VTLAAAPKGVPDSLALALDTLGFGSIQNTGAYSRASAQQKKMIVLLCAHSRGRRFWDSMALATGLSLEDIGQSRLFAITQGLLGGDGRLKTARREAPCSQKPCAASTTELLSYFAESAAVTV
jgi:hypothetical protein